MKVRLVCINPFTKKVEKECERYPDDKCCMCSGPELAFKSSDINQLLEILKTEGINSKQKAINLLESMKDGEQDDSFSS